MIYIVTAPRNGGKTQWCLSWAKNRTVLGVITRKDKTGNRYTISCSPDGPNFLLGDRTAKEFRFHHQGIVRAAAWILAQTPSAEAFLIDELGPLEQAGEGWLPLLRNFLKIPSVQTGRTPLVITCRPDLVSYWTEWFRLNTDQPIKRIDASVQFP